MKDKREKRFIVVSEENSSFVTHCTVLVDRQTGVNYLMASYGQGTGLTPLLNREGKPIITSVYNEE